MTLQRELEEDVLLAEETKKFLTQSPVGRLLQQRVDEAIERGLEELKTVDPEIPKLVREAQNKVYRAESIMVWLNEIIVQGEIAWEQLQEGE